uniref:Gag protein n=1 Tax=Schistocephalus solidus TaxID=70667 RepID=A0A183TQH0_SCHSO
LHQKVIDLDVFLKVIMMHELVPTESMQKECQLPICTARSGGDQIWVSNRCRPSWMIAYATEGVSEAPEGDATRGLRRRTKPFGNASSELSGRPN